MKKSFHKYGKLLSVMLTVALLVSLCVPAIAADTAVKSGSVINTSGDGGMDVVNLTIGRSFEVSIPVSLTESEALAAADSIEWTLVRDNGITYTDPKLYPNRIENAKLEEVMCSDKKTPLFTVTECSAETVDGQVCLTMTFDSVCYFGKDPSAPHSNGGAYLDPCGYFNLTASLDGTVLGFAPIKITPYDNYHIMAEIYATIDDIVSYGKKNTDLYIEKFSMGVSQGDNGLASLDMPYIIIARDKAAVDNWRAIKSEAENDPSALIAKIESGALTDYQVPVLYSNVHANEVAAADGILYFTEMLVKAAANDGKIDYKTLTGFTDAGKAELAAQMGEVGAEGSVAVPDLVKDSATYLGYIKGEGLDISGKVDMEKYYTMADNTVNIDDLLDDVFFIIVPEENVEGRTYVTRTSSGGFDLNRDNSFQTQAETQNMTALIAQWNPVSFTEFHGRVEQFQCEPCDPPHEPNFEYDLLAEHLVTGGESFGIAAVANNDSYNSYVIPQRDYLSYTGEKTADGKDQTCWYDPWDDMSTSYTPQYSMLHGTVAYTVELPAYSDATAQAVGYGCVGQSAYVAAEKASYLLAQTKIYERGVTNANSNAYDLVGQWFCDQYDVEGAEADLFRPVYDGAGENGNFYPECYIIPLDGKNQSNLQAAADMMTWLARNGVKLLVAESEFTYKDVTYPAGTLVVSMYQAKRSVANGVLYNGTVITEWPVLYSEGITAFNKTRGFDMVTCTEPAEFSKISQACGMWMNADDCAEFLKGVVSSFSGDANEMVIISNASEDSTAAVNALLKAGKKVGMILSGDYAGSFICDYAAWTSVSSKYLITGIGVAEADAPLSLEITAAPTLYINGKPAENATGFFKSSLVSGASAYNYDRQSMELLGFNTTEDVSKADLVIGASSIDTAAAAAIKNGTPYIGYGSSAIMSAAGGSSWGRTVQGVLFTEGELVRKTVSSSSMDALGYVTYPNSNIVSSSYVAEGDDILYGYGAGYFESIPAGSEILVKLDGSKDLLEGFVCSTGSNYKAFLDNSIQAIAYQKNGMNLVLFANTLTNKVHQRDEFNFISNMAFSTVLGDIFTGAAETKEDAVALADTLYFDVQEGDWYAEAVGAATAQGLFNGMGANQFAPNGITTRAQLVTILYRMEGSPAVEAAADFSDVASGLWYSDPIAWASANGIVNGYTDGTFKPNATVTREQIAAILYRYAAMKEMDTSASSELDAFGDASAVSAYAVDAMKWAVGAGLINGSNGNLLPTDGAIRAQAAAILTRFTAAE